MSLFSLSLSLLLLQLLLFTSAGRAQAPDPADIPLPVFPNGTLNPSGVVNTIRVRPTRDAAFVHTRQFAQLPPEGDDGRAARIMSMTLRGRILYVCTLFSVYRVSPSGRVTKWLDGPAAIVAGTRGARNLSTLQTIHGGIRSIAFPRRFPRDPRFYLSVMETRPNNTVAPDPDLVYLSDVPDPINADSAVVEFRYNKFARRVEYDSYRPVLRIGMPVYDHPIKQLLFRFDRLFVAHGDGATQNATLGGGQNADGLGKILRIIPFQATPASRRKRWEPVGLPRGGGAYSVPRDNPFVADARMLDEVWALGFRNPHTLCFGHDGTLYAGETGRANVEEVNLVRRGRNYGWSKREGQFVQLPGGGVRTGLAKLPANDSANGFEYPAAVYGHIGAVGKEFTTQAIAGGCPVENGSPMSGSFYYADFPLSGRLFFSGISDLKNATTNGDPETLTVAETKVAIICLHRRNETTGERQIVRTPDLGTAAKLDAGLNVSSRADIRFGQGRYGELYWSSKANGRIYLFTSSLRGGSSEEC